MNINLLRKPRVKRHDLIYQFLGNALWKEGRQRQRDPTSAYEPGGAGMGTLGTRGSGKGSAGPEGSLGPSPESGHKREAELAPSVGQKLLGDCRGPDRGWCQRRRWGTQAPCGRLRAKPALQTQRKEPLVFTQRSLLHSSPRWFSSRHSSMSGCGGYTLP